MLINKKMHQTAMILRMLDAIEVDDMDAFWAVCDQLASESGKSREEIIFKTVRVTYAYMFSAIQQGVMSPIEVHKLGKLVSEIYDNL